MAVEAGISVFKKQDRQALELLQMEQLRDLLRAILPDNPFYSEKLSHTQDRIEDLKLLSDLARLPFTTRAEIFEDQSAHPPYGTNLTYDLSRYVRLHQTSGTSTGRPLRWLDTEESWEWILDCWRFIYEEAGVRPDDRLFFPFSFGPFLGFWAGFAAATRQSNLVLPGGGMTSEARLRFLLDNQATVVCCTPTYAIRLAEIAEESGVDLPSSPVRLLIVAGEPGGSVPAVRERIESGWGARCIDHTGMTEVGSLGIECVDEPGNVYLIETECIPEVIVPETGEAITGDVAEGELVLTTLGRIGSPLIRYRTGDVVRVDNTPCSCGRTFTLFSGGIIGRADDMVVVRGVNIYPAVVENLLRRHKAVDEFRVAITRVRERAEIHIEIECRDGADAKETMYSVRAAFESTLGLRPEVTVVPRGTLPRFELKAQRFFTD